MQTNGVAYKKSELSQAMSWPSPLRLQLYFHDLLFLKDCTRKDLVSTLRNLNTGTCVAYAFQLVIVTWNPCTGRAGLESIQTTLEAYLFYNNQRVMFEVISSREQGYVLQLQRSFCAVGACVV